MVAEGRLTLGIELAWALNRSCAAAAASLSGASALLAVSTAASRTAVRAAVSAAWRSRAWADSADDTSIDRANIPTRAAAEIPTTIAVAPRRSGPIVLITLT